MLNDQSTVIYLDFVKDVNEISDSLIQDGIKEGKYTGKMKPKDA